MTPLIRQSSANSLASSLRWRMISVPRAEALRGADGERPRAVRLPLPARRLLVAPGPDPHRVGDHERRVEADSELADQRDVGLPLRLPRRHRLEELERAAVRDRPEVRHQLVVRHPDAVVADDQPPGVRVPLDDDLQWPRVAVGLVRQRDVPHLVQRIGGVRDQLAEGDLASLVERMRQQVEQLLDLGLKRKLLLIRAGCHRQSPIRPPGE